MHVLILREYSNVYMDGYWSISHIIRQLLTHYCFRFQQQRNPDNAPTLSHAVLGAMNVVIPSCTIEYLMESE